MVRPRCLPGRGRARWAALATAICSLAAGCSDQAASAGDGAVSDGGGGDGATACGRHHDCPQTQYCYEGRCVADPQLAVYHCGKRDAAGRDTCPPGRWCVTADGQRSRCDESTSYPCEDACDCGPAHCCVEVTALGGRRCVKDPADPFVSGGEAIGGARCEPGVDPTHCADAPSCYAAQRAFALAGRPGEFLAWRRGGEGQRAPIGGSATATCGAERCFGTACQCDAGETCLDLFAVEATTPELACGLLAGGSCVSNAVAEAVFGVDPRQLLPCCASLAASGEGCLPGERCEVGWIADRRYAYRRVTARCGGCGDGQCSEGEYPGTCPQDCGCGDGRCDPAEIGRCDEDCGQCGDGRCAPGESYSPPYFGACGDCDCGSGSCDRNKSPERCPQDCSCGDGLCSAGEDCAEDCVCAASPYLPLDERVCGDGYCEEEVVSCTDRETCLTCSVDCGPCEYAVTDRHHATSGLVASDIDGLNAVWAPPGGGDLLAAGEWGQILRFDGERWTRATPALHKWRIRAIWGSSASDVYFVGDGYSPEPSALHHDGTQWTPIATPPDVDLAAVWGSPKGEVIAVGAGGKIVRLTGAGFVQEPSPTASDLRGVWGLSDSDLHAVGDGVALRFDGATWAATETGVSLRAIWGASATEVLAVGDGGAIRRFDGSGWAPMSSPTARTLRAIWGRSSTEVWAVGDGGTILQRDGATWREVGAGVTKADLRGLVGYGGGLVAVGGGVIVRHDAKQGWRVVSAPGSTRLRDVWGVATAEHGRVVAVGMSGTVLELLDGPSATADPRWSRMAQSATGADLAAVWGSGADNIYAVGAGGAMIRFDGASWLAVQTPTDEDLRGIWGSAAEDIFVVGGEHRMSNVMLRFDGRGWQPMGVPFKEALWAVWGSGRNDVYAVGDGGVVLHFDGSDWRHAETVSVAGYLTSIWGTSANNIYTAGKGGEIYRFDGRMWEPMPVPRTPGGLDRIWGTGPERVFAAGGSGTLLTYDGASWRRAAVDIRRSAAPTLGLIGWGCEDIYGVWGPSAETFFLVGDLGVITRLTRAAR